MATTIPHCVHYHLGNLLTGLAPLLSANLPRGGQGRLSLVPPMLHLR